MFTALAIFLLSVIISRPVSVLISSRVLNTDIQVLVSNHRTHFVALRTRKLPLILLHIFLAFFLLVFVLFCLLLLLFWGVIIIFSYLLPFQIREGN